MFDWIYKKLLENSQQTSAPFQKYEPKIDQKELKIFRTLQFLLFPSEISISRNELRGKLSNPLILYKYYYKHIFT